jgi:hypothetical protein
MKTTYRAYDGHFHFELLNGSTHVEPAERVDHPQTVCEIMDKAVTLSSYERWSLVNMLTSYELTETMKRRYR